MDLGAALKRARGSMSQDVLAETTGIDQPSISKWERGLARPSLEQMEALERALKKPRGYLLVVSGWIEDVSGVEQAIAADPQITEYWKTWLLVSYRAALELSSESQ